MIVFGVLLALISLIGYYEDDVPLAHFTFFGGLLLAAAGIVWWSPIIGYTSC